MRYRIKMLKQAEKDIQSIPAKDQSRVIESIDKLQDDPRPHGIKALKGEWVGYYRLRIGSYRIIYQILDQELVLCVVGVPNRKDAYR